MRKECFSLGCIVLLAGCGGGSSGTTPVDPSSPPPPAAVTGLELPANLSLITARDNATAQAALAGAPPTATAAVDFDLPGTDYSADPVEQYVYDDSMQSLNIVNEIICYMSQTRASEMVNEGPYIALINEDRCRQGENQSSTGDSGQSSSADRTNFARWVVDSVRADNASPQTVRIWLPNEDDGMEFGRQHILVETTVTEGVSDTLPFGSFTLDFRGVVDGEGAGMPAGTEVSVMTGSLQTVDNAEGRPQFRFINLGGDAMESGIDFGFGFEEAVNVILDDAGGNGGRALSRLADSYTNDGPGGPVQESRETAFAIAYDVGHFLSGRDDDGDAVIDDQVCRSRDDFDTRIWRYNLYHAVDGDFRGTAVTAGQRVALNSGFPFSFDRDGDGAAETFGWVGYNGIWVEDGDALADGQTIVEYDYDTDVSVERTVRVSPGRLIRRSASQLPLADLAGEELQFWGQHPTLDLFDQWLVTVGGDGSFSITARFVWGDRGPELFDTVDHDGNPDTPEEPVAATLQPADNETVWFWSDALGGDVIYVNDPAVAPAQREATFYLQEFVAPGDAIFAGGAAVTLYCYDRCLKGGLTQSDVDSAGSDFDLYHPYQGQAFTYTLTASEGRIVLTDDGNGQVVDARALSMESIGFDWGINSGEMLTEVLADPGRPWTVYNQPVSYRWETGPNDWNVLVSVVDASGNLLDFDRPLQFNYVHTTANDANSDDRYDGERFLLEYSRVGDLHGFPWTRENENSDRWYPLVALADGVELNDGANDFVVKALEKEQSMQIADSAQCASLDVDGLFSDTELELPTAADIGTVSFTLADRPVVTDAPAVIDGELQE